MSQAILDACAQEVLDQSRTYRENFAIRAPLVEQPTRNVIRQSAPTTPTPSPAAAQPAMAQPTATAASAAIPAWLLTAGKIAAIAAGLSGAGIGGWALSHIGGGDTDKPAAEAPAVESLPDEADAAILIDGDLLRDLRRKGLHVTPAEVRSER